MSTEQSSTAAPGGATPLWMRVVIIGGAVLAVFLLGASLGILLSQPERGLARPQGGAVDIGFAQDMSVHHRQAVLMAGLARERSDDPTIRSLAFDIERTQLEQIGQMQGWLSLWNAPTLPPDGRYMTWMTRSHGMDHGVPEGGDSRAGLDSMPGMATPDDLGELRSADGVAFDVLFLQLMLRHHEGGVPMAQYAAEHAETAQVRNLAEKMLISQGTESAYLAALLDQRDAEPLPSPI